MPIKTFVDRARDPRTARPPLADEHTTLTAFLRWQRQTLELKCSGLDAEQLAHRPVGTSALSLLGLMRHLADAERFWFRRVMSGTEAPPLFETPSDPDGGFNGVAADPSLVAQAWDAWRAEVAFADRFIASTPDLDTTGHEPGEGPISLRWVLMHLLEEYARHNGHADLLREQIDGAVGQ
ncbi:DinB family protein [Glycomyces buryatensis]|uniref:DinB family protein n=1 Tax=Glycomyces buryatensis TaxID=2570927 RepID=A0A4S8QKK7_9ACTN|nr:DinB family protein [Glycomyces buryatensis]THV41274.1 DinB family protein [Glycomyces buryatensis]